MTLSSPSASVAPDSPLPSGTSPALGEPLALLRQALRCLAAGLLADAHLLADRAAQDLPPRGGKEELPWLEACQTLEVLLGDSPGRRAAVWEHLSPLRAHSLSWPQLRCLYRQWALEGRFEDLLADWQGRPEGLDSTLPESLPVLGQVLEASLRLGRPEPVPALSAILSRQPLSLQALVASWPLAWTGKSRELVQELEALALPGPTAQEPWLLAQLERWQECYQQGDLSGAERQRARVQLWLGEPVPLVPRPLPLKEPLGASRVRLEKGRTLPFAELPPDTLALDGYVQGPAFDPALRRYSFDHHAGCIRHATLSTCEMTLDALRVGLDPAGMEVRLNDLDPDTVLATWLLLRPGAARDTGVETAIRRAGRLDALGPAHAGPALPPALSWALSPVLVPLLQGSLRSLPEGRWETLLEDCLLRLDRWREEGAPPSHLAFPPCPSPEATLTVLHRGPHHVVAQAAQPFLALGALYASGVRAAVVARPLPDGTTEYTVGKASEFVQGFDVPALLALLRAEEKKANPAQAETHTWGGGSTIGGSPRNPDGSSSRLRPEDIHRVLLTPQPSGTG